MIIEIRGEDADPELRGRRFRVLVEELYDCDDRPPVWIQPFLSEMRPYHYPRILQEAIDQLIGDDE